MAHKNEELIAAFYTAFNERDYKVMQAAYADTARFSDPVFVNLDAHRARAMWEMFCTRGKDLAITFANVNADDHKGSAEWTATYTFSATNRRVVNVIKANFLFEGGKITRHTDHFDFYKWSRQALGLPGLLLGRTSFLRKKTQAAALKNLQRFMSATAH